MRRFLIGLGVAVGFVVVLVVAGFVVLRSIDWNEHKAPLAEAVFDATGRKIDLSGDVSLEIGLRPGVVLHDVRFQNAEWGSRPDMAMIERLVFQLRLIPLFSGRLDIDKVELIGLDLLLETNPAGLGNWSFASEPETEAPPQGEEAEEGAGFITEVENLVVERSLVVWRPAGAGSPQKFDIERLAARRESGLDVLRVELSGRYDEQPIGITGDLPKFSALIAGESLPLDVTFTAGGATSHLKGQIDPSVDPMTLGLSIDSRGGELADWSGLAGSDLPRLGSYRLSLALEGKGESYEIRQLDLAIGESKLLGEVDLDLSGKRPRVAARLRSPKIDMADLQEPTSAADPAKADDAAAAEDARIFSAEPLPIDSLDAFDGTIALTVESLASGGIAYDKVDLRLRLDDRRLRTDPLALGVAGGRATIFLDLDARSTPPRLALRGSAEKVVVSDLTGLGERRTLEGGTVDLQFDLRGRGASIAAVAAEADGTLVLDVGNTRMEHEWAGFVLGDVESIALGTGDVRGAKIQCAFADFVFAKGIGRPKGLVIDLESLALFGRGSIDLASEKLALRFDREGKGISASRALPPFVLAGTFADPSIEVDATRLAGRVVGLGADVLTGDVVLKRRTWPKDCRALLAAYEKAEAEPSEAEKIVIDKSKQAIDSLKGLLRR